MDVYADIPSRPYTFRGALAFNQRTVSSAIGSLLGNPTAAEQKPISLAELTNVLLLLESIATSSRMCLDGTLPPGDLRDIDDAIRNVHQRSGVMVDIEFLKPSPEKLTSMFKSAADAAALLMEQDLGRIGELPDPPVEGDISKFVNGLQASELPSVAVELAQSIAESAAHGVETFRGSKCLAALVLADQDPVPVLELARHAILRAPDATQRKAIAILINRFRVNYVNSLAGLREAAYLADRSIEDLKAQQVVLFSQYFARKISEGHLSELSAATQQFFDQSLRGVPLGFAVLMNSRGASALDLLGEAMRIRDAKFAAAAAAQTPQALFVHQLTDDEFAGFQDYLFKAQWTNFMSAQERAAIESCPWRSLRIPAAVGPVVVAAAAGVLIMGPGGIPAGAAFGGLVSEVTRLFVEKLGYGTPETTGVPIDQYRKFDQYFSVATNTDKFTQALSERVELLFGRRLAGALQ